MKKEILLYAKGLVKPRNLFVIFSVATMLILQFLISGLLATNNTSTFTITSDKSYYQMNETVHLQISGPNSTEFLLTVYSPNKVIAHYMTTDSKGKCNYSYALNTPGNYTVTAVAVYNETTIEGSLSFFVEPSETMPINISSDKKSYKINESINLYIQGPPEQEFNLLIEKQNPPEGVNISVILKTSLDGTCEFNTSLSIPGRYVARVDDVGVEFEVIPSLTEIGREFELEVGEEYRLNQTVSILVSGTPSTSFSLNVKLPLNMNVMIYNSTNETGWFVYTFQPDTLGVYEVELTAKNVSIKKYFNVTSEEETNLTVSPQFKLQFDKKTFLLDESIEFSVLGPNNTNFVLEISSLYGLPFFYQSLTTGPEGKYTFISRFGETGDYVAKIFYNNSVVAEETFEVVEIVEVEQPKLNITTLWIEQGRAEIGYPVEWKEAILIENLGNETEIIRLSTFATPPDATFIGIECKDDNFTINTSVFAFQLLPNQSKTYVLYYSTPAPEKYELDQIIFNNTWSRVILVENKASVAYSNISVSSEMMNLFDIALFEENENITNNALYNVALLDTNNDNRTDTIGWTIPALLSLESRNYTIVGKLLPQITFDRAINCSDCRPHKVPPFTLVNISIFVNTGVINITNLIDYYPSSWKIVEANNGTITVANQTHNKIEWNVSGTIAVEWYLVLSPDKAEFNKSYFQTEIYGPNVSMTSNPWEISILNLEVSPYCDIIIDSIPFYAQYDDAYYCLDSGLESDTLGIIFNGTKNIVLDCLGNYISGKSFSDYYGVHVVNGVNTTIKNCEVNEFEMGIYIEDSYLNILSDNNVEFNKNGIVFYHSQDNELFNNTVILNSNFGVLFYSSFNNTLVNNSIHSNFDIQTLEKLRSGK